MLAMLKDVLAAVTASRTVTSTAIVTPDPQVAGMAGWRGITVIEEEGSGGMNAAIGLGVAKICSLGGRRMVILPADLPLLTGDELDRLVQAYSRQVNDGDGQAIGITPSTDGGGTNCLFMDSCSPITFQYGPGSFKLHRSDAEKHRRKVISLASPVVSMDIDEPGDIDEFLVFCEHHPEFKVTETWRFLQSCDRQGKQC